MKVYTKFDTSDHVFLGFSTHNTQVLWVRVELTCLRWMTQTDWDPHSPEKHVADVHCHSAERENEAWQPRWCLAKPQNSCCSLFFFTLSQMLLKKKSGLYYSAKGDYVEIWWESQSPEHVWSFRTGTKPSCTCQRKVRLALTAKRRHLVVLSVCEIERKKKKMST